MGRTLKGSLMIVLRYLIVAFAIWFGAAVSFANAVEPLKNPLSYSMREYGAIIGIAMLGGFVRWYTSVRRGQAAVYDIRILVGELMTSAFIGILIFWACEAYNVNPLITAALTGMGGHMGISLLMWVEKSLKRHIECKYGLRKPTAHL